MMPSSTQRSASRSSRKLIARWANALTLSNSSSFTRLPPHNPNDGRSFISPADSVIVHPPKYTRRGCERKMKESDQIDNNIEQSQESTTPATVVSRDDLSH